MLKNKIYMIDKPKIIEAFDYMDNHGIPAKYNEREYVVINNGKEYPPKYTLAVARFLQYDENIDTSDFNSTQAIDELMNKKFKIHPKDVYVLTITKDSVTSTDPSFSIDNLGAGDYCDAKGAYFISASGDIVYRKREHRETRVSNMTLPRIACQIYEKNILSLTKHERLNFPICKYNPKSAIIRGIFDSVAEFKKYRNSMESMKYATSTGEAFVIYSWNVFSTVFFVQECLKRFGNDGDSFVLFYAKKANNSKLHKEKEDEEQTNEPINQKQVEGNDWEKLIEGVDKIGDKKTQLNQILYGPPGTGKTYNSVIYAVAICEGLVPQSLINVIDSDDKYRVVFNKYKEIKEGRIEFITFHQSYGYEEFIQGIKPNTNNGQIEYKVEDGVFKKFCEKAKDKQENFVFIIDEINRGNVSKIFGELITLIEESKRLGKPEGMEVRLPYKDNDGKDVYFGVPNNVYILGTMNTADRSLVQLDAALRRRFRFIEMMPNYDVLENKTNIAGIDLKKLLEKINERITVLIDREHQIGHSYFTKVNNIQDLKESFENEIIPLLQEYFYEDYEGIKMVLGGQFIKSVPQSIGGFTKNIYRIEVMEASEEFIKIYESDHNKNQKDETETNEQVTQENEYKAVSSL